MSTTQSGRRTMVGRLYTGMILFLILITGTSITADEIQSPEILFQQAEKAMNDSRFEEAYYFFMNSSVEYAAEGNQEKKLDALRQAKRISWMFSEMIYNQTSADETIAHTFPQFSHDERSAFLKPGASIQFVSDGKTYYYEGIARNVQYHNKTLSQNMTRSLNESPFFDQIMPHISAPRDEKNPLYQNHTFVGTGKMSIPRNLLPDNGTLQVWLPLPVEIESQTNISVLSLEPEDDVISGPVTTGTIGEVYFEIPLDEVTSEYVNTSVEVAVTTSPRINNVNPDLISGYDTSSMLYQRYTHSQPNINVTPEIVELAHEIVGDEKNPYKKAKLIYNYILNTLPYSNVPHSHLTAMNISESDFVHETGFGDCGTQSVYFSALCRAVGIPARAPGGYQIVPGHQGTHFWAEFYLPEYGWIPVDVTVADAADWAYNATPEQIAEYKDFFFGNLDPYRFTIQTDVDELFSGEPNPDILMTFVHQKPAVVCTSSDSDLEMLGMIYASFTFEDITAE